ncbi:hypothetical protein ACFL3Y_00960 [Pseudomonadota bacterium]
MGLSIKHVHEVPPDSIVQFLEEQQGTPPHHSRWKYFDEHFNAGRPRGFAAIQDSRLVGFLGLIPFKVSLDGETRETAWTCDWCVDAERASGALGIALLKAATASFDALYHTGGSEVTKQIFSRLANVAENKAVREYRTLLRLRYITSRAEQRSRWLAGLRIGILKNIPLKRLKKSSGPIAEYFTPGVSKFLVTALESTQFEIDFHPSYDAEYIHWFARNPGLECYSCAIDQNASALLWHPNHNHHRQSETEWRLALFSGTANSDELSSLADLAVTFAAFKGADSVKVQVSHKDKTLCTTLEASGFSESRQLPFFAFYHNPSLMPSASMAGHSFLDTDNGH